MSEKLCGQLNATRTHRCSYDAIPGLTVCVLHVTPDAMLILLREQRDELETLTDDRSRQADRIIELQRDLAAMTAERDRLAAEAAQKPEPITPKQAIEALSAAFKADPDYAWGWHCNLAGIALDAGADHASANGRAASFMRTVFGVDTMHAVRENTAPAPVAPEGFAFLGETRVPEKGEFFVGSGEVLCAGGEYAHDEYPILLPLPALNEFDRMWYRLNGEYRKVQPGEFFVVGGYHKVFRWTHPVSSDYPVFIAQRVGP